MAWDGVLYQLLDRTIFIFSPDARSIPAPDERLRVENILTTNLLNDLGGQLQMIRLILRVVATFHGVIQSA